MKHRGEQHPPQVDRNCSARQEERLFVELDRAFGLAVMLAWGDLAKVSQPSSVRLEYRCEPGVPLDQVSVWSTGARGNQHRVCDYWTSAALSHPHGAQFRNGYSSDQLARALDLVMKNQDQFTRPVDACCDGLALIYPPSDHDRAEAASWIAGAAGPLGFGAAAGQTAAHSTPPAAAWERGTEAAQRSLKPA